MTLVRFVRSEDGSAAVELALTGPLYILFFVGFMMAAMLFWIQIGLQKATEVSARCATINRGTCGTSEAVKTFASNYAKDKVYGFAIPSSVFSHQLATCGNEVTANYAVPLINKLLGTTSITLQARSCFPT